MVLAVRTVRSVLFKTTICNFEVILKFIKLIDFWFAFQISFNKATMKISKEALLNFFGVFQKFMKR